MDSFMNGDADLATTDPVVQQRFLQAMLELKNNYSADGFRWDFVHGYGSREVAAWLNGTFGSDNTGFSVGEYWITSQDEIKDWADSAKSLAFDFALKNQFQSGNIANWKYGMNANPSQSWREIAVTFVDNHDTGKSPDTDANDWGQKLLATPDNLKSRAYAYILSMPGTPCIYWPDYYDWGYKAEIDALIAARKAAGIVAGSAWTDLTGSYSGFAGIVKNAASADALAVSISSNYAGPGLGWVVKASKAGEYTVWIKDNITVTSDDSGGSASLGTSYRPNATTFTLWSPESANVQLWLNGQIHPMTRLPDGNGLTDIYAVTIAGDQHLKRYNFRVNGRAARDPYGVMVDPGTDSNIVVNMALTDPVGGWAPRPPLTAREDAIIYEVHVRDFTIDSSSGVDPEKRGKFLGMVQSGTTLNGRTTGLDHLKELGVTHVQILPFFDFRSCSGAPPSCYNWGYDPLNFNIPEERYSLKPNDPVERIRELKTMINEFHKAGIRVIMDVVYNHTADGGGTETTFTPITKQYFLGSDISGTGNTVDNRKPMVSRFIRDSLEFWVREYHIDGFRFDLMGIFDYAAVGDWGRYLRAYAKNINSEYTSMTGALH